MVIDVVSQTTGAERTVAVEAAVPGLVLAIAKERAELVRVEVPADRLLAVLTDRPVAPQQVVAADATRSCSPPEPLTRRSGWPT